MNTPHFVFLYWRSPQDVSMLCCGPLHCLSSHYSLYVACFKSFVAFRNSNVARRTSQFGRPEQDAGALRTLTVNLSLNTGRKKEHNKRKQKQKEKWCTVNRVRARHHCSTVSTTNVCKPIGITTCCSVSQLHRKGL